MRSSNTMKLIRIRMRNQFELSKLADKDLSTKTHALITNIGYLFMLVLVLAYVASLPFQMKLSNQLDLVNPYIFSLLFWALGIWSLLSGIRNIFYSFDHDQLFVLPIDRWKAILLNVFSQLITQVVICAMVMLVSEIVLYVVAPFPLINLFVVLMFVLITPLLATGLSIAISLLVKVITSLLRIRNILIEAILTLFIFISPMLYSFANQQSFDTKSGLAKSSFLRYSLLENLGISHWMQSIVLAVLTVLCFILLCGLIVKKYDQLVILMGTKKVERKQFTLQTKSTMAALLKKEASRYFSSFSYVVNTILAPCALVIVGLGLNFGILPEFSPINIEELGLTITSKFVYYLILVACATLTTSTACSFSFEGKMVWIIQSLPISIKQLSIAKGLLNIFLFIPGIVIAIIDCWVVFGERGINLLGYALLLVVNIILITIMGLFINLKFPSYNWTNEMVVVKQSMSVILTAVVSIGLIAITALSLLFLGINGAYLLIVAESLVIAVLVLQIKRVRYL
ncbi:hypothetical protein [Paenibacillus sp. SN-8-1]|uniref:hypothetical protein n=1 Tax=Paenibacillus sp. SN-8-1 TaxID=3435409 RepID=UPI003D9A49CA